MHKLLLGHLLLLALIGCTTPAGPSPEPAAPPAAPRTGPAAEPLLGVVAARVNEVFAARVDGRILRVTARPGQRVRAGDLIAEIDPTLLTERLRAATAAADAARAELAGAGTEVSAARRQGVLASRLLAASVGPYEAVALARTNLARAVAASERAAATLREATATRAGLEAQLSGTRFEAPVDGVLSLIKTGPGEVVAPGAVIARVFDPDSLMIRFQVLRDRRQDIAPGAMVELTVAGAGHPLRARVSSVSTDLEPPLDFAVAEADILDPGAARDVQIGTLGEVRVIGPG
ncbi:MAG TPA: HlyD family efflux transporter periplasmic adaptor subunit [Kofleriaceae bacterium]|jgi:multidrug efflux pump subunit AcrA (membrane-fusion protein)|nr:HlyD family efflux transporter periplasmic adaptor subunit [Kofleriaceae bacterium]